MKKTIEDFRAEYKALTGKDASIRWIKGDIQRRITDYKILQAGHEAEQKKLSAPVINTEPNPAFEQLASTEAQQPASQSGPEPDVTEPLEKVERRGGYREGAGRPAGTTEDRNQVERLLQLEKPDLAVKKVIQGLNLILAKFTPAGFNEKQVESIALGVTLPLYYWFPNIEGAMNPWTLHFQALEYISVPLLERQKAIADFINANTQEKNDVQNKDTNPAAGQDPAASVGSTITNNGTNPAGKGPAERTTGRTVSEPVSKPAGNSRGKKGRFAKSNSAKKR